MNLQIVMDSCGDTRHEFDPANSVSIGEAAARFRQLTDEGYRAVALGKAGQPGTLLREFDAKVEQTLFIPQLQGG